MRMVKWTAKIAILIVCGLWPARGGIRELGISSAPAFWAWPTQGKPWPFSTLELLGIVLEIENIFEEKWIRGGNP